MTGPKYETSHTIGHTYGRVSNCNTIVSFDEDISLIIIKVKYTINIETSKHL